MILYFPLFLGGVSHGHTYDNQGPRYHFVTTNGWQPVKMPPHKSIVLANVKPYKYYMFSKIDIYMSSAYKKHLIHNVKTNMSSPKNRLATSIPGM